MQEKTIELQIAGRDLADLEAAARDMNLTVEQLLEMGAREAVQSAFKLHKRLPAQMLPFKKRLTAI